MLFIIQHDDENGIDPWAAGRRLLLAGRTESLISFPARGHAFQHASSVDAPVLLRPAVAVDAESDFTTRAAESTRDFVGGRFRSRVGADRCVGGAARQDQQDQDCWQWVLHDAYMALDHSFRRFVQCFTGSKMRAEAPRADNPAGQREREPKNFK